MGRAPCCDKNGLKKGPWTQEEDQKLIEYIQKHGHGSWRTLPKNAGLSRCGKSCRLRWTNYLRPDIKRGRFSFEEEETIIQLHSILGNKWSAIAARLPGRTDNEIKNYWNTHIRKRLLRMGIDPVTHSPRLDHLDLSSIFNPSLYNQTQFNVSRLLGIEPFVNPEFLKMATILSSQHENLNFPLQNDQEKQFTSSQIQDPFACFQNQPLQTLVQENPTCTTSSSQLFSDPRFMQTKLEEFPTNPNNFNCQNNNFMLYNLEHCHDPLLNCGFCNPASENLNFQHNNGQNFAFGSVLSTPASSPTHLNSSSTYINSSACPAPLDSSSTYINSSTEDERDTHCSNMLNFEITNTLDINQFM